MQADRNDRFTDSPGRRGGGSPVLVTAAALLIVAGIAWLLLGPEDAPPEAPASTVVPETPDPTPPRVAEPVAPDIPARTPEPEPAAEPVAAAEPNAAAAQAPPAEEATEPPLSLDNSDPVVREQLAPHAAEGLPTQLLGHSNLLERTVAAVDAVRRGVVPGKVFNLPRPKGDFQVRQVDGRTVIDPASYRRYDDIVAAIVATPVEPLAAAFQDYRSLLETAYGALGYAPNKVDNALVAALDRIIALPVPGGDIEVMKVEAVYAYVDEDLEGLKALDKQLLRTGPENLQRLQEHARALRRALLEP